MSFTTLKRRKHKSLESLSKGKESVDQLLMQASQVYSATSHWQSQVDAAELAKQDAVGLLENVQHDLQASLQRISALEALRHQQTADVDSARQQAADREAEVRSLRCQHATLADDSETAQLRAAKAESQMQDMLVETQHLRDAASQAIAQQQGASSRLEGLQTEAAKAKAVAERHQEMVASLTADNLVFLMRLKRCEGDLVSAVQERDELRLAVEEQRGPWFEEVADVRAGVEERVKTAMAYGGLLQTELDGLKACHGKALDEAYSHVSQLQEQVGEQKQQLEETGQELSRCQQALDRSQEAAATTQHNLSQLQQRCDELAAENRVLMEGSRSMRHECNEAWMKQEAACSRVDGLVNQIAALQDEVSSLQGSLSDRGSQLQNQMAMNQQLMKRKEDMEWQLMSLLAQGSHSTPEPFMSKPLADRTNQGTATQTSAGSAGRLQHPSKSHTISHSVLRTSHTMTHPAADENSARGNLLPAAQQCRHPVPMGPADVSHDLEKQADEAESLADEHDSSQQHAPTAVVGAPQSDDAQSSRPPVHLAEEAVQDAHLLEDVSIAGNNEDSALSRESPGRQTFAAHAQYPPNNRAPPPTEDPAHIHCSGVRTVPRDK
ncbi:MAG: hypothetical protein FRX49_04597 [Trebouxia sp. A1-2]|nr:MAG: hypothetical protein FRX49_04597 [Trebouxia sp. A1-2]